MSQCEEVDALLAATKVMAGTWEWTDNHRHNERRAEMALTAGGQLTYMRIVIKAFPNHEELKFTIMLVYGVCVWRICHATDTGHLNPLSRPAHLPFGPFDTPHYHPWAENRPASLNAALPKNLKYANFLPAELTDFNACFEWFCTQTNIQIGNGQMPILPLPDRLL
ncbi:hypothetical protein [Sphingobium jiangsuense]|uniref:hypothetical protein n=1 Tax=Sphingobium jiangsuense TaxID=870476 RepID=UPI001CB6F172|nr:hypothetical protein [Sphingobium jiangsuense]